MSNQPTAISKSHAVYRTSPKGTPFVGTCSQCGEDFFTLKRAMETECPNQRVLTEAEALLEGLESSAPSNDGERAP